jgi:hypothetical protein
LPCQLFPASACEYNRPGCVKGFRVALDGQVTAVIANG